MTTFPPLWIETLREVKKEIRAEDSRLFSEPDWNLDAHVPITLTVRECRNLLAMLNVMETMNALNLNPKPKRMRNCTRGKRSKASADALANTAQYHSQVEFARTMARMNLGQAS